MNESKSIYDFKVKNIDGDILDMRTNKVSYAFIRGKKIDLDDKQKRLYKK
jgi:hypothetical protein